MRFLHFSDYGLDNLIAIAKRTKFPWLMSNVLDIETSRPLAEGKLVHIIEKKGKRVNYAIGAKSCAEKMKKLCNRQLIYICIVTVTVWVHWIS